jgi:hypothetical protein
VSSHLLLRALRGRQPQPFREKMSPMEGFATIRVRRIRQGRGLLAAAAALVLTLACADERSGTMASDPVRPTALPEIALDAVSFPDDGLPDPCEILHAAGAKELLVRPVADEPMRFERMCLIEVERGRRPEPQVSAALELATRDGPQPANLEEYVVDYGEGPILAGVTRGALERVPELGEFAVWFPHADGSLTLSAFWGGSYFLSVEVHGVDREIAFAWSKELAARVIERVRGDTV